MWHLSVQWFKYSCGRTNEIEMKKKNESSLKIREKKKKEIENVLI